MAAGAVHAADGWVTTRGFEPTGGDDLSWLVESGALTAERLAEAEARAEREHTSAAVVLLNDEVVSKAQIARARGESWGTGWFDDLHTEHVDASLSRGRAWREYLRRGWLPVRRLDDGTVLVATFLRPTPELRAEVETELGGPVVFPATARWALRQTALRVFATRRTGRIRIS